MRICTNCGEKNEDTAVFCLNCGNQFIESTPSQNESRNVSSNTQSQTIKIQPIKFVKCPHCNKNVEITAVIQTQTYFCDNCSRSFNDKEPFKYQCVSCTNLLLLDPITSEEIFSCSNCGQNYEIDQEISLQGFHKTRKSGLVQISSGFLIIVGLGFLVISLLSMMNLNSIYRGNIPTEFLSNFLFFIFTGLIIWGFAILFMRFIVPEREFIIIEGISILILCLILTMFTIFIHSDPLSFSKQLPMALIIIYSVWVLIRLILIPILSSEGLTSTDIFFMLCVCDSCNCLDPICENCDC